MVLTFRRVYSKINIENEFVLAQFRSIFSLVSERRNADVFFKHGAKIIRRRKAEPLGDFFYGILGGDKQIFRFIDLEHKLIFKNSHIHCLRKAFAYPSF